MTVETRRVTSREEWLRWRMADLTASDVAAVAGLSPWRTPLAVYAEKSGMVAPDGGDSDILRRGRWLEPAVVAAIRDRYPDWDVRRAGVYLRDPDVRLGATPDAVAAIPGVSGVVNIQLKVVARSVWNEQWSEDEPPVEYQVQTLSEGLLMDASHNLIAALVIGEFSAELEVYDVPRHRAAEERAVEVARDFWLRVEQERPPAMDYAADGELVSRLYPQSVPGKAVDLTADPRVRALLDAHEEAERERKAWQAAETALETELRQKMGDAERAIVPGWRVTNKSHPRAGYVVRPAVVRRLITARDAS